MPVKQEICAWDDCCKGAFKILPAIAIPIGIVGAGWYFYSKNKSQVEFASKLKHPSWMIKDQKVWAAIDLMVMAPIGYAAHTICKEAKGQDRKVALGLYGAGLSTSILGFYAFTKVKDVKCWFGICTLSAAIYGATAFSFYKLNQTAGLLLVPLTAWMAYVGVGYAATIQPSSDSAPKTN